MRQGNLAMDSPPGRSKQARELIAYSLIGLLLAARMGLAFRFTPVSRRLPGEMAIAAIAPRMLCNGSTSALRSRRKRGKIGSQLLPSPLYQRRSPHSHRCLRMVFHSLPNQSAP